MRATFSTHLNFVDLITQIILSTNMSWVYPVRILAGLLAVRNWDIS